MFRTIHAICLRRTVTRCFCFLCCEDTGNRTGVDLRRGGIERPIAVRAGWWRTDLEPLPHCADEIDHRDLYNPRVPAAADAARRVQVSGRTGGGETPEGPRIRVSNHGPYLVSGGPQL